MIRFEFLTIKECGDVPEGPVGGLLSQNCVWSSWPVGMKQQVSATAVVLWHDRGESLGQDPAAMAPAARAETAIDFCIMIAVAYGGV